MMIRTLMLAILGLVASFSTLAADPGVWYVDDDNYGKGGTGTESNPFGTIQDAIDKASAGDIIHVAEGLYNQGERAGQTKAAFTQRTRVVVDKRLTILGAGRDKTIIEGEIGDGIADKDGTKTVQCVWIADKAAGTLIQGVTLRNGAACTGTNGTRAGAIGSNKVDIDYTLAYCTVTNCVAYNGGMNFGTAVGTLFINNGRFGDAVGACDVSNARLYNCILAGGRCGNSATSCGPVVNCTFVNNYRSRGIRVKDKEESVEGGKGAYYNSAIYGNMAVNDDPQGRLYRSFMDSTSYLSSADESIAIKREEGAMTRLLMAVAAGDFRPVAGGRLDGTGNRDYLAMIPEAYRNLDFNGNPIAEDAPIPIGAILPTATPAAAGLQIEFPTSINGCCYAGRYACHYSETWPAQVRISAATDYTQGYTDDAARFIGVKIMGYEGAADEYRYCGKYDNVVLTLPPARDGDRLLDDLYVKRVLVTSGVGYELYVDCAYSGDDSDGSQDKPYKTIQAALDVLVGKEVNVYRINVAKGTYNEGGGPDGTTAKFNARLVVPYAYGVVVATDGPDETFVEGQPDPDTAEAEVAPGCGPKAYRCLSATSASCKLGFVGFTFRKGHTSNDGQVAGGAVRGATDAPFFYDCVFTDNHAFNGASCLYQGTAYRCLFKDNEGVDNAVASDGRAFSCLFVNNRRDLESTKYMPFGNAFLAAHVSVCEPLAGREASVCNSNGSLVNSVVVTGGRLVAPKSSEYIVSHNVAFEILGASTFDEGQIRFEDPLLAAPHAGDFRPREGSPVFGAGDILASAATIGEAILMTGGDFNNELLVAQDGSVTAGAVATTRAARTIYVDAESGSDSNDGSTEALAKKTLKAAAEIAAGGDTIIALPGTYADGTMGWLSRPFVVAQTQPQTIPARVTVPYGVTLCSRDGAATTVIRGAAATEDVVEDGLGPNAIRGVLLESGATIRGFTIENGHTHHKDVVGRYDSSMGGGVLGRGDGRGLVEDCVLQDNVASYGGALSMTTANRCRIIRNGATNAGQAAEKSSVRNAFLDGNIGSYLFSYPKTVENITLTASNKTTSKNPSYLAYDCDDESFFRNILCLAKTRDSGHLQKAAEISGFILPSDVAAPIVFPAGATGIHTNEFALNALVGQYDADGRPRGNTTFGVDLGSATPSGIGTEDLDGNPRVMNGTIDIGCYEFDWRGAYAKSMGKSGVTVVEVTPGVVLTDGHALMSDGDALALDCPAGKVGVAKLVLTGTGTVNVYLNGRLVGTLTESGELKIEPEIDVDRLAFAYEGTGSAYVAKLSNGLGTLMILR